LILKSFVIQVLSDIVKTGELSEPQAVAITENALFHNANRLYKLGLVPRLGRMQAA